MRGLKDKDCTLEIAEFCDLCGQSNFIPEISVPDWDLVKCGNCGLVCTSPRYSEKYVKKIYHDHYYEQNPQYLSSQELNPLSDEIQLAKSLKKMIWGGKEGNPRFLDVGCGAGRLVQAFLKAGWDAMGVDLSPIAIRGGVAQGLNLFNGSLDALSFGPIDLIAAMHFLEHVHSPKSFLTSCWGMLSPTGYLLIEVPDYGSRNARKLRERWPQLYPDTHLYQFTSNTLQEYLSQSRFKVVQLRRVSGRGPLEDDPFTPPQEGPQWISLKGKIFELRHLLYWSKTCRQLTRYLIWQVMGYGDFLRVLARKDIQYG
jgi:2-polyprenyl-3-methyl-5-hydroxy-6-metoxy-1,4-benzoquinol methylase